MPIKNQFHFSYGYNEWLGLHKNVNIGLSQSVYYSFNQFDSAFNNPISPYEKQRYANLGLRLETKVRFALFNTQEYWTFGPFLDVGAAYQLPISFRFVQRGENVKTTYSNLHRFNDVHVFAKLGYTPVSVMVDYRVFDFVKSGFPQAPRWSIGLSFVPEL